jgi:hypothetical protein
MHVIPFKWRRASARLLRGFAASALLAAGGTVLAAEPAPMPAPAPAPTASQVAVPDLRTARQIALEHQPTVLAARASLSAALTRRQSLDRLHLAGLVARDLSTRKHQADLGVEAAAAAVQQAEADAVFAVSYCFLAYEFAWMQESLAGESAERVEVLRQLVMDTLKKEKRKDVFQEHVKLTDALTKVIEAGSNEAKSGKQRALAALGEALGLGPNCVVVVPGRELPEVKVELTREAIVATALARRGEVAQANLGAEVTRLEIDAQKTTFLPTARTFAQGSDLHATLVSPASLGSAYHPGGITIEMPPMLTGHRGDRVEQATELAARADAVADKTRNLVALEAEDAFLRWQEMGISANRLRIAADDADIYNTKIQAQFDSKPEKLNIDNPTIEDLVIAGAAVGRLRAQANEARFNHLVALALLERVTAGGICVNFDQPPPKAGK